MQRAGRPYGLERSSVLVLERKRERREDTGKDGGGEEELETHLRMYIGK